MDLPNELCIFMTGCTAALTQEIEAGLSQAHIAKTYALAMHAAAYGMDKPDWPLINRAILVRWSMSGLERIKRMAHKHYGEFMQAPRKPLNAP